MNLYEQPIIRYKRQFTKYEQMVLTAAASADKP